jgi:hypothetical protein
MRRHWELRLESQAQRASPQQGQPLQVARRALALELSLPEPQVKLETERLEAQAVFPLEARPRASLPQEEASQDAAAAQPLPSVA